MIRKKAAVKPEAKIAAKLETTDVENTLIQSKAKETVSVKIKKTGEYASWGIELMHSIELQGDEDASNVIDGMIETLEMKCVEFADKHSILTDRDIDTSEEEFIEETPEEIEDPEEELLDLDEDGVREMNRKDLIALIKEQELEVDPKDFKKLPDLVEAVLEALFPPEESEEESEEETEEESEEGELTEDAVREMDRKELIELIKEQELEIDPKEFKKTSELTDAVIEALFAEDITPDAVREMDKTELLELIKSEELDIDPKKFKKVDALAEEVISLLFEDSTEEDPSEEEFGDFDSAE